MRKEFGSVTFFVHRLANLKYALVMANMAEKKITTFCPKTTFPTIYNIKAAICDYLGKDEDEWRLLEGVCPEVSDKVDTAVVVAELLNILVNGGDLE